MTIPYSKQPQHQDDGTQQEQVPSAPPDYLDDDRDTTPGGAALYSYGTSSTIPVLAEASFADSKDQHHYAYERDPETLLPIATPLTREQLLKDIDSQQSPQLAHVLGFDDSHTRMMFIRKVYGILAGQLLLTAAVCAWMVLHLPTQTYVLTHAWPTLTSIVLSLVLIVALMCFKTQYPHNVVLLIMFTIVEAFLVGTVTTAYCAAGYRGIVLEAVFITCAIFVGLTLFTCQSKINFSFLGAGLSMGLGVFLVWGLLSMVFGFEQGYVYALFGCLLFCGYILFDTWLIMDQLEPHEYVLAAIMLYLDLINLFLYVLRLLASSSSDN